MTGSAIVPKHPICLAAGGTGGHVFPAIAVAQTLNARGYRTVLFTDHRGAKIASASDLKASPNALPITKIAAASPFQRGIIRRFVALAKLGIGAMQCLVRFLIRRPVVIVGFGGYPSFAPLFVGTLLQIPVILHEQNAFLGRANHLLARRVGTLALSWEGTRNLPEAIHIELTGMPVRAIFHTNEAPAKTKKDDTLHLAIFGGSQGAAIFAALVPAAIRLLPADMKKRLIVTQQAHTDQIEALQAIYADMGVTADMAPFFADIAAHIRQSDLIISRAGASSVAELAAIGAPTIFIPFSHAMDDHQTENAMQMQNLGGGLCLAEGNLDAHSLARHLANLLGDPALLADMAKKAKQLSMPDAAAKIADMVEARITGITPSPSSRQGVAA